MLSTYAYHHYEATPLMCSVITGSFEATAVLLGAGARTDLRNARGCTVVDLARETSAPDYIMRALEGPGEAREKLVKDVKRLAGPANMNEVKEVHVSLGDGEIIEERL